MNLESRLSRRRFVSTAYNLGRAVALTALVRGAQTETAAGLFLPDRNLTDHPAYFRKYKLPHGIKERNRVAGFGDSNMGDWQDKNWPRLMNVLRDRLIERGVGQWEQHTFSWNGSTAEGVFQQIEANKPFLNSAVGKFDAWINVGGNNVAGTMFQDPDRAAALVQAFDLTNPENIVQLPENIGYILGEINRNIAHLGRIFPSLLDNLVQTYPDKLRNVVVVTMPDFSVCEAMRAEEPRVMLQGWDPVQIAMRKLLRGAAMGVNRELLAGIDCFSQKYGDQYPILAVNTWNVSRSSFRLDNHYSVEGHQMIADNAIGRIEVGR